MKLISLLMDLNQLLQKINYYFKFDFFRSINKTQQLLFILDLESQDYILYQQLDDFFLYHERIDYQPSLELEKTINIPKTTKENLVQLVETCYQKFEYLDPYLKSIFIEEIRHIQELYCLFKYEGKYVSKDYLLRYINLHYLKDDE